MSAEMILNILIQNRVMLIEALMGNIMNCIAVYTLFGKRKYDWFFPAACAVRYVFYNIGLLSIWNAMYGTQSWYKITMSTLATGTAFALVVVTALVWKEPLVKVLIGVFAAECITDGIMYQVIGMKLSILKECVVSGVIFLILYLIVRPLLKKYRIYIIKHEVICLTILFTLFISSWISNILYNTSASIHENPMYMLGTSLLISVGCGLALAFTIHTRNVFQKKKQLEQNKKQMENYYQEIQHEMKEMDYFKIAIEGTLDTLTNLTDDLSQKEKTQQIAAYIGRLKTRYENLNQHFFCKDYLIDGILTDFALFCKQHEIETDILFQNYHRGNIKSEDSVAILLKLIEYAKQAGKVKLHAAVIKNQLVYSMELEEKATAERAISEKIISERTEKAIVIPKKAFKKYLKKYDGEIRIEKDDRKVRVILGIRR